MGGYSTGSVMFISYYKCGRGQMHDDDDVYWECGIEDVLWKVWSNDDDI